MTGRNPAVSVVIPVRNRRDLLVGTLDALDAQTFGDFEVIVVDDASSDGSRQAAERLVAGRPVRVYENPGRGAVSARQHACDQARAPLLAFTDSDCRPSPKWLEALVREAEQGADLVTGPTLAARTPRPLERTMTSPGDDGGYPTCNILYRRELFEKAGGFVTGPTHPLSGIATEASLLAGFWEDTLMGWRLRRVGALPALAPDAVVYHHVFPPDIAELLRRTWSLSVCSRLIDLVPEMAESHLRQHLVLDSRERGLVPLIGLSLLLRQRRLSLALTAGWAFARLREHRKAGVDLADSVRALPVELAVDVVRTVAIARGQLATRTMVL